MEQQFIIKHQDGDIIREVSAASIVFKQEDGVWKVGLEIETTAPYATWSETEAVESEAAETEAAESEDPWADGWPRLHLMDFPVGAADPRAKTEFEISVPQGSDGATLYTNFYFYEHEETNHNLIKLTKLADDKYLVEWTCASEDIDYYDEHAQDNQIVVRCQAQVIDQIAYPW